MLYLFSVNPLAQNVFNPYKNYAGDPMPYYIVPSSGFPHSSIIPNQPNSNYSGEYMIQFDQLPWFWQNSPTYTLA